MKLKPSEASLRVDESRVIELKKPSVKQPVMIVGLPGIGLVSKLSADNLVKTSGAQKFAVLYSKHFPNQVLALSNGKLRLFGVSFYHAKVGKRDAVIVKGDLQPLTIEGQYEVSSQILEYFKSLGGREVISMAGYAINRIVEKPKVFASSSSKSFFKKICDCGASAGGKVVPIVGMAGLLPSLARLYGIHGACLLVETPGSIVDAKGSIALTQVLSKFIGAKIDTKHLDSRAAKASKLIQQFEQQAKVEGAPAPVVKHDELSYIR